jgi:hypothetical protein
MAHQLYFVLILWFGLDMALGVALDCAARQRDTIIAISRTYNSMYNHEFYDLTWKSTNRKLHFHVTSHHSVTTNKISMKSPACSNLPLISHPPERTPETILKKENVNNPAPGGGEGRRTFFDAHASPWQFRHRSFAQTHSPVQTRPRPCPSPSRPRLGSVVDPCRRRRRRRRASRLPAVRACENTTIGALAWWVPRAGT